MASTAPPTTKGEWQWEEDGYTVTRTYTYSAPGLP